MKRSALELIILSIAFTVLVIPTKGMDFTWATTPATHETSEGHFIQMSGDINAGDYEKFKLFVQKNLDKYKGHRFVQLSSNGGNLVEALKIAELLRLMYPSITVKNGKCASSCFFLYLSGSTRYVDEPLSLGIHRAYFDPKYFAGLKPGIARSRQIELTKVVNSILDENGVPQYLKDIMNRTPSNDIYWLSDEDMSALGEHPAWYEELMIAKCDYGTFLKYRKKLFSKSQESDDNEALIDNIAESYVVFKKCEDKIVDAELSNLSVSLVSGKR